jgi:hypothetical protein
MHDTNGNKWEQIRARESKNLRNYNRQNIFFQQPVAQFCNLFATFLQLFSNRQELSNPYIVD